MASVHWLELRIGSPGQSFLLEHLRAYKVFDQGESRPRMILAVGGEQKKSFFLKHYNVHGSRDQGVALRALSPSIVVADCWMHTAQLLRRAEAGPARGNYVQHDLQLALSGHPRQVAEFAWDLYWQVLVPFTPVVLLFLGDLGGIETTTEALAKWVRRAMLTPVQCPPRLLIIHPESQTIHKTRFISNLHKRVQKMLRNLEPFTAAYASQVDSYCQAAFESVHFIPASDHGDISNQMEQAFEARTAAGLDFRGEHLRFFLKVAVSRFGQRTMAPFDFCRMSRMRNLVSSDLGDHLVHFITSSRNLKLDHSQIIASALEMDAYPPGMHFFHPSEAFDKLYGTQVSHSSKRVDDTTLPARIRDVFLQTALERRFLSSALGHRRLLRQFSAVWRDYYSVQTCLVCLMRAPSETLNCGHLLCTTCVVIYGLLTQTEPWKYRINHCPLCSEKNQNHITLKPPTAGTKVLKLGGTARTKSILVQFLKEFQALVGLPLYPLRDQFDLVLGSDIGAFFAQTIFLEGWSIADCRHHLPRLQDPKLRRKGIVSYGKGLDWELSELAHFNGPKTILYLKDLAYSNKSLRTSRRAASDRISDSLQSCDILVEYGGGGYDSHLLREIAARMHSSLFYVELVTEPTFYSAPETIRLRLLCRLPPGPPLMSLLSTLKRRNARVYYGADGLESIEPLVGPLAWGRCREGDRFVRGLSIPAASVASKLSVKIDSLTKPEEISNSPYELCQLIRDQGLDCVFGRKDHRVPGPVSDEIVSEEVMILCEMLDRINEF
ncbi:hypothetical protein V8F33_005244 [Rhypophila sp. PSN 637]